MSLTTEMSFLAEFIVQMAWELIFPEAPNYRYLLLSEPTQVMGFMEEAPSKQIILGNFSNQHEGFGKWLSFLQMNTRWTVGLMTTPSWRPH
jgi:hypothetical protein